MPRIHVPPAIDDTPWQAEATLVLEGSAARHVQVLRLQPGEAITLWNGLGGQWSAQIESMGRQSVRVRLKEHTPLERELPCAVTLAVSMPANDRMDDLVEKATELGAAAIIPLMSERSVLRLSGERALKKQQHWQGVALAACEQCGRNRFPVVAPVQALSAWTAPSTATRWMLSLADDAQPLARLLPSVAPGDTVVVLSGPEGGLSPQEQAAALAQGFVPVSLGARTLRADTAPLAALASLATWISGVA
jgi:16S rRNA (uracil1498-N3)-methyltransferase